MQSPLWTVRRSCFIEQMNLVIFAALLWCPHQLRGSRCLDPISSHSTGSWTNEDKWSTADTEGWWAQQKRKGDGQKWLIRYLNLKMVFHVLSLVSYSLKLKKKYLLNVFFTHIFKFHIVQDFLWFVKDRGLQLVPVILAHWMLPCCPLMC